MYISFSSLIKRIISRLRYYKCLILLPVAILLLCGLPQDPATNPENVSITITCDAATIGVNKEVTMNLSLFLDELVDSIRINFGDQTEKTFLINSFDTSLVIQHKFAKTGTFRIYATAYADGVERIDDYTITVVDPVVLQLNKEVQYKGVILKNSPLVLYVIATGTGVLSYEWYKNGTLISGEITDSLKFPALTDTDTGHYSCIVKNVIGSDSSKTFQIVLSSDKPVIVNKTVSSIGQPKKDSTLLLYVAASGNRPLQYQWYKNNTLITGASADTLKFAKLSETDTGSYVCVVSNTAGSDTSTMYKLSLIAEPPVIQNSKQITVSRQPEKDSAFLMYIRAGGSSPLAYQWYKDGNAIADAKTDTLLFTALKISDTGNYKCAVSNSAGADTSLSYTVQIGGLSKPLIQNSKQVILSGKPYKDSLVTLSVSATGTSPLSYKWYMNNSTTVLSSTPALTFTQLVSTDTGLYYCVVANDLGSDTSMQYHLSLLNRKPAVASTDTIKISEDPANAVDINISGIDPDGDVLTFLITKNPSKGTVSATQGAVSAAVEFSYTPGLNTTGIDSVLFVVNDGKENSDTARVFILVAAVNDPPVISGLAAPLSFNEDGSITLGVNNFTVTDPDNVSSQMTLTVYDTTDGNYTHSGNTVASAANFNGTIHVPVTISDGTAESARFIADITVTAVADPMQITITSPANNSSVNYGEPFAVSISFSNIDGATKSVEVKLGDSSYTYSGASPYAKNWIVPFSDTVVGVHTIYAKITDTNNTSTDASISVNVTGTYASDSLSIQKIFTSNSLTKAIDSFVTKRNNRIGSFKYSGYNGTEIRGPDYPYSNLRNIGASIGNLTALDTFQLASDTTDILSSRLNTLPNLVFVKIDHADLGSSAMKTIYSCRQLSGLDMNQVNGSAMVTDELGNLTNLTYLSIYYSGVTGLPASISNLTKLSRLFLSTNELDHLPIEIGMLTSLTEVDLQANKLTSLPTSFGQLVNLKTLIIGNNKLSGLSDIYKLVNLDSLYLSGNKIRSLPSDIGNLKKLRYLNMSGNPLQYLPGTFAQLTALAYADFSYDSLAMLPSTFGNLTSLKEVNFMGNLLTSLCENFGSLSNLEYVQLNNNKLDSLPSSFSQLSSLKELYVMSNKLKTLPASFGQLTALTELNLTSNILSSLPSSINNLVNLTYLSLYDNKLCSLSGTTLEWANTFDTEWASSQVCP